MGPEVGTALSIHATTSNDALASKGTRKEAPEIPVNDSAGRPIKENVKLEERGCLIVITEL